jgi:hypothetical protein
VYIQRSEELRQRTTESLLREQELYEKECFEIRERQQSNQRSSEGDIKKLASEGKHNGGKEEK